jgi:hypothetical protein
VGLLELVEYAIFVSSIKVFQEKLLRASKWKKF